MNKEQLQSIQSWYLQLLPITLPFASFLTANIGLMNQSQELLGLDNILFVLVGATLSGLLPISFTLGIVFLIANALHESKRHYYFVISFIVAGPLLIFAYHLGQNLYF
jgi:hypothetical protein